MHYLQSITVSLVYRTRSNQKRDKNNKTDEHEHEGDTVRLNSFLRRCWKLGYSNRRIMFEDMCAEADEQLFDRLINETNHVLHHHHYYTHGTQTMEGYFLRFQGLGTQNTMVPVKW